MRLRPGLLGSATATLVVAVALAAADAASALPPIKPPPTIPRVIRVPPPRVSPATVTRPAPGRYGSSRPGAEARLERARHRLRWRADESAREVAQTRAAHVLVRGCIRASLLRVAGAVSLWRAEAQLTGDAEHINLGGLLQNALASCFASAFPRAPGVQSAARYVALELFQPIAEAVNADRSAVVVENWLRRTATGI